MYQFDANLSRKFWVQPQNFDSEGYLVGNALPRAVAAGKEFEVFVGVILTVAIFVMNCFFGEKLTAKFLFHVVTVFKDSTLSAANARRNAYPSIASFYVGAYVAGPKTLGGSLNLKFYFALVIAKVLSVIQPAARFAGAVLLLAAFFAIELLAFGRVITSAIVTALHGTIKWVFVPFLSIGREVRRLHSERLATGLASKSNQRHSRSASHDYLPSLLGKLACVVN